MGGGRLDPNGETYVEGTVADEVAKPLLAKERSRHNPDENFVIDPLGDSAVAFATTQITHPENRANPRPGDPAPSLTIHAHDLCVAYNDRTAHTLTGEGADASEDGTGRWVPLAVTEKEPFLAFRPIAGSSRSLDESNELSPTLKVGTGGSAGHQVAICFSSKDDGGDAGDLAPTIRAGGHHRSHANARCPPAVAFHSTQDPISGPLCPCLTQGSADGCGSIGVMSPAIDFRNGVMEEGPTMTLQAGCHGMSPNLIPHVVGEMVVPLQDGRSISKKQNGLGVGDEGGPSFTLDTTGRQSVASMNIRRLTPRECERLQGFPDDWTKIDVKTSDGPRYKAIGNSMAVTVMRWIGERLAKCPTGR